MPTYDAKQVKIMLGPNLITGYADGSFCNIEYNEDSYTLMVGADGEAVRSKSNNKSATITFTLLPTSEANAILDGHQKADQLGNIGMFPLDITDLLTGTKFATLSAWVKKDVGQDFQKEAQPKAWTLETARLESIHKFSKDAVVGIITPG